VTPIDFKEIDAPWRIGQPDIPPNKGPYNEILPFNSYSIPFSVGHPNQRTPQAENTADYQGDAKRNP
jgi:hypothetical protein